jgi:hypothetical protein
VPSMSPFQGSGRVGSSGAKRGPKDSAAAIIWKCDLGMEASGQAKQRGSEAASKNNPSLPVSRSFACGCVRSLVVSSKSK